MTKIKLAAAFAALLLAGSALAQEHSHPIPAPSSVSVGDLRITGAWARAMLPGQKVAGGYLTIVNSGAGVDRLVGARSPAAPKVEIHEMKVVDDVMTMRSIENLEIAPGATVEFKPGGLHIMLMDVPAPIPEGAVVPLTLQFEKAGSVELQLPVRAGGGHGSH